MRLGELVEKIGGKLAVSADADVEVSQVAPILEAKAGNLTFVANPDYVKYLPQTKASAVIVAKAEKQCAAPQVLHDNPYLAFARAAQIFNPPPRPDAEVSPRAMIAGDAILGEGICVYPFAYVGSNSVIGDRVIIYPGVYIGEGCVIGDDSVIHANTVIEHGTVIGKRVLIHGGCVIGGDGFGFAPGKDEIVKIPQIGKVVIEDDVEIGSTTSIDRAAMGETRIGRGTKLDSKVHIGHNVQIGEHCMFSGFVGIAGSTKVGNWVLMGGHAGINGHIEICDRAKVGAMTGVVKSITEPETVMGFPAVPASEWRRHYVYLKRMGDYEKRLRQLESKLSDLSSS